MTWVYLQCERDNRVRTNMKRGVCSTLHLEKEHLPEGEVTVSQAAIVSTNGLGGIARRPRRAIWRLWPACHRRGAVSLPCCRAPKDHWAMQHALLTQLIRGR